MKPAAALLVRAGLVAVCGLAAWRSVSLAVADSASAPGTVISLAQAAAREPRNADFVARAALLRADSGDTSPAVDRDLEHALTLNPLDSEVLMALGLRREFDGNLPEAEKYLRRAADVDHAYRASWAWAGYAFRHGLTDEFWRMARRCLALEPLGYDPGAIFDFAWRLTDDSKKILDLVPRTGPRPVQYLDFLLGTGRLDAAAEAWPLALNSLDPSSPLEVTTLVSYTDAMARDDRFGDAVRGWNQLVERGQIQSGRLDPENGKSLADPAFSFPQAKGAFGWGVIQQQGAFGSFVPSLMRFEFDGNEPESLTLASVVAPVVEGRSYRLVWKYDSSRLASPKDAGFSFAVARFRGGKPGDVLMECGPLLAQPEGGSCAIRVPAGGRGETSSAGQDLGAVLIELRYTRALGTVRIRGELRLTDVHLEFAS